MIKLKSGDKVKLVKSETYESNDEEQLVGWVSPYMDKLEGKIFTLGSKNNYKDSWRLKDIDYWYHENWLKPVVREKLTFKRFMNKIEE